MTTPSIRLVWLLPIWAVVSAACGQERGSGPVVVDGEFNRESAKSDVVLMLIAQLGKSDVEARDAATKLAQVGKPAVPMLADLVERGPNEKVKHYATVALSRIRHPSAAEALLPLVTKKDAPRELRLLAIDAAAGSNLDRAAVPLAELAGSEDDAELRVKALQSLSIMPVAWRDGETLFTKCLSDRSEEIRLLATHVCFYAAAVKIVYGAAEPKLLEMVENDPSTTVRCRSLRALARMKSGRAVPVSVRLVSDRLTSEDLRKQAIVAIQTITEVPIRDAAAVELWWEKHGKERYTNAPALRPFTLTQKELEKQKEDPKAERLKKTAEQVAQTPPARAPNATSPATTTAAATTLADPVKTASLPPEGPARTEPVRPEPNRTEPARKEPAQTNPPTAKKRLQLEDKDDDAPLPGIPIR